MEDVSRPNSVCPSINNEKIINNNNNQSNITTYSNYPNHSIHQQQQHHQQQQQQINYSQSNFNSLPHYPITSNNGFIQHSNNPFNNFNAAPNQMFNGPPSLQQHFMNTTSHFNHHLNSSLHQPHSIDLSDSLSRSFNGVPTNFPLAALNPPPFLQALPYLTQNNQISAELHSWIAKYSLWQETVKRNYYTANNKNLIPLKYEKQHSSIRFGNSNQLITVKGKSIFIQNVKSTLIESAGQTLINIWCGPLIRDKTKKDDIIEYIKGQEKTIILSNALPDNEYLLNCEKSQIWQLLSMMIKQNGDLSSSELAEFLITKNEAEFYTDDGGTEIGKFRRLLLLGQKKNALDYARKAGLWGHNFALAYLISNPQFNEIMINSVNDFTDSTLSKEDPIFTLYRRLLQNLQKTNPKLLNTITTMLPPSNLQQLTILLANNCEVNPSLPGSAIQSEVLKLVVALRDGKSNFINLNNLENYFLRNITKENIEHYSEELLFMNEIYEFCQKPNLPLLEIIPFKAIFAAKLYDYGLVNQAKKYCEVITNVYKHLRYGCFDEKKVNRINWQLIMYMVELIESKIDKVLNDELLSNFQPSPLYNETSQTTDSQLNTDDEEDLEEIDDTSEIERLNLDSLNINNDLKQKINNINQGLQQHNNQQQQQQFINNNRQFSNRNTPFSINSQQQQQQQQLKQHHQQPPQSQINQRERSDSIQSTSNRQRTASRTSSNLSNLTNRPENYPQSNKNQFNQPQLINKPINDNLPSSNLIKPNKPEPIKPPAQQPTFFVPSFSPSDNLPAPIDFVSKPIEPTNLLDEQDNNDQNEQLSLDNRMNLPASNQVIPNFNSNFNSTLNPPTSNQQINNSAQNIVFSPAVSPITSPVINSNQMRNTMSNLTLRDDRRLPPKQEEENTTTLDQTDNELKNKEGTGFMSSLNSWVKDKVLPKKPHKAHLPDDSKNRFYYDQEKQKWVDTEEDNDEQNQIEEQIKQGPPKIPVMSQTIQPTPPPQPNLMTQNSNNLPTGNNFSMGPPQIDPNQFSFTKSKQRRYVDILQQN